MNTFTRVYTGKWDYLLKGTKSETPALIKAVKFELNRAEGPSALCGPAQPVTTWKDADNILRQWSRTAPDKGQGYDKCDFTITWADGETYTGRYDLKRHDGGFTDLLGYHVRSFLTFYSGNRRPDWMTPDQYEQTLNGVNRSEYSDFLSKYEIGNTDSQTAPVLEVIHTPAPVQAITPSKPAPAISKQESGKVIQYRNIQHRCGSDVYNVDILPGRYIRLFGTFTNLTKGPKEYDISFELGDTAEYDSYNLIYTGEIVSIGPKTVTIKHYKNSESKSRLSIIDFAWKNWDYSAERIAAHNQNESYYI